MTEGGTDEGRDLALTEEPTVPRWYDAVIAYVRKRERTAVLRRELAEARKAGKERRNRDRLRRRSK